MSPIRNGVRLSKQVVRKIIVRAPPVGDEYGLKAITNITMFLAGCFTVYEVVRRKRELRRIMEAYKREEE